MSSITHIENRIKANFLFFLINITNEVNNNPPRKNKPIVNPISPFVKDSLTLNL